MKILERMLDAVVTGFVAMVGLTFSTYIIALIGYAVITHI